MRAGYTPQTQERRECPKCCYPMLHAEKLPKISDQVGVPDPSLSWLSALFYELLIALLISVLIGGVLVVVLNFYYFAAGIPTGLVALSLLALEGLMFWKLRLRLWVGWKSLLVIWYAAAMSDRDHWRGDSLWTTRRDSGHGGGNGLGIFLGILLFLPAFHWVTAWFPPALNLSGLALLSLFTAVLLGIFLLPELIGGGVGGLTLVRHRKRQKLMDELAPGDWVCPNCLYAEKA